jgi:hypothetical protein
VSQDRLRRIAAAAAEAARAAPGWLDSDELAIIVTDDTDTVLTATGFGTPAALAGALEYHAGKLRHA